MKNRQYKPVMPARKYARKKAEKRADNGACPAAAPCAAPPGEKTCLKDKVAVAAGTAQVLLVAMAVFGYFYTVMPMYRKGVLAESVAQHEAAVTALEEKNSRLETQIQKNESLLSEQDTVRMQNRAALETLKASLDNLSQQNLSTLQAKKDLEAENARLQEELESKKKELLSLQSNILRNYRYVFTEGMKDYSVSQFTDLYVKSRNSRRNGDSAVGMLLDYKNNTLPAQALIEKSLNGYARKLSESYALIPVQTRKNLAEEYKKRLAEREDLKTAPFSEEKVLLLLNERDRKIFDLPDDLSKAERSRQTAVIGYEYNKKVSELLAEFRREYIRQVRDFFVE